MAAPLRVVDADHPEHGAFVAAHGGPLARFPLLQDGGAVVSEATAILEHLNARYPADPPLIAPDAVTRDGLPPDAARGAEAQARLRRAYAWLERWLVGCRPPAGTITLVECAAAPSLFHADRVEPIGADHPRLTAWRAALLALPPVARCIAAARPYGRFFPPGAPDRN